VADRLETDSRLQALMAKRRLRQVVWQMRHVSRFSILVCRFVGVNVGQELHCLMPPRTFVLFTLLLAVVITVGVATSVAFYAYFSRCLST